MSESEGNLNSGVSNGNESTNDQKEIKKQPPRLGLEWFDAKRFLQLKHEEYVYKAITNAFQSGIWWMRAYYGIKGNITDKDLYEPLNITQGTYKVWKHSHVNWDSFKGWAAPKGRPKSHYNEQIVREIIESSSKALDTATITEKVNDAREEDRKRPISDKQVRNLQRDQNITSKLPSTITTVVDPSLHENRGESATEILDYLNNEDYFPIFMDELRTKVDEHGNTQCQEHGESLTGVYTRPFLTKFTIMQACSKTKAIFSTVFTGNITGLNFRKFQDNMLTEIVKKELHVVYKEINGERMKIMKRIVIILDNIPVHGFRFIEGVLRKHESIVQYQPAYCRESNLCNFAFSRLKPYIGEALQSLGALPSEVDILAQSVSMQHEAKLLQTQSAMQPQNSNSCSKSSIFKELHYPLVLTENTPQEEPGQESEDSSELDNNNSYSPWHTWLYAFCVGWMAYDNSLGNTTSSLESTKTALLENITKTTAFTEAVKLHHKRHQPLETKEVKKSKK